MSRRRARQRDFGFGIFRAKYFVGEALDYGIPTYDGNSKIIDATMENGRRQGVGELLNELNIIVNHTPPDDKTSKRRKRLEFLRIINSSRDLSFLSNNLILFKWWSN